jgi:hypothetical protein
MSDAPTDEHLSDASGGRHRGEAAPEEADRTPPHGRHRREPED